MHDKCPMRTARLKLLSIYVIKVTVSNCSEFPFDFSIGSAFYCAICWLYNRARFCRSRRDCEFIKNAKVYATLFWGYEDFYWEKGKLIIYTISYFVLLKSEKVVLNNSNLAHIKNEIIYGNIFHCINIWSWFCSHNIWRCVGFNLTLILIALLMRSISLATKLRKNSTKTEKMTNVIICSNYWVLT